MANNNDLVFGVQIVAVCLVWYGSSSSQNIINKLALQSFPYPITIAMSSLLNNVLYSIPLTSFLHIKQVPVSPSYLIRTILPISVGRALAVTSAYFGLLKLPVSFSQTVKGTMPLFTVMLSRFMLGEKQSGRVYASLILIIFGVFIASFTELQFNTFGLISALFSTFTFAYLNVLAKKVFEETQMHPVSLLSINSQIASLILFPLWALSDGQAIWSQYAKEADDKHANDPAISTFLMFLVLSGLLGFIQNLCAFILIHQLTTLSYAISNASKRIVVILLSLVTLKNPVTILNIFGMLISIMGIFVYNRVKHTEKQKRATSPVIFNEQPNQLLRRRERTISLSEMKSSKSDVKLLLSGD